MAIFHDQGEVAGRLISANASITAKERSQRTPLHFTACYRQLEIARLLLEADADPEAVNFLGNTALHDAIDALQRCFWREERSSSTPRVFLEGGARLQQEAPHHSCYW